MPPFRTGLLKRRNVSINTKVETVENVSDEESNNTETEDLLKREFNLEDDETDSEKEPGDEESDGERDELESVVADDGSDDEQPALDESSELTDSEEGDDSEEDDEGSVREEESDEEGERGAGGSESEPESGVGPAHSSSNESDEKRSMDRLADSIQRAGVTTQPVAVREEYESGDTSDEEERRNTAGEVPMWWYEEYPHVGYDVEGRRIMKPAQRDRIDDFLRRCEDPEFWRTVRDPATGQDVLLSEADLQLLARVRAGRPPTAAGDRLDPWPEWFSREVLATPLRAFPDHKRSFLPSRDERRAVSRLVHALRMGWLKSRRELAAERRRRRERRFYDLWGAAAGPEDGRPRALPRHIPAPRRAPPSHAESYNPPPEYLLDETEMKEWNALAETPWKRKYTFLPARHASLRAVPAYGRYARERFLRCLDLYLAPRALKMRLTIGPEALVPALPAPRDLRPFPAGEAVVFRGHTDLVRCCDLDPSGQYAVSGGDDGTARVWELASGRCLRTLRLGEPVARVAWTPAAGLALVAVAAGAELLLWNPGAGVGAHRVAARTDALLEEGPAEGAPADARTAGAARWERVPAERWARGVRLAVVHFRPVAHCAWHARGDYLATTLRDAASRSVVVHQVSRRRSQLPFARAKGLVQCCAFHPTRPLLFVATQRAVRVYDLVRGELVRKLRPGAQWLSSVAVHPAGDHLLVGSYDRKVAWFDLELSAAPYRTLRLHAGAVRAVAFHRRYPLWASAGDDGAVVGHGAVYADLLRDPLLVPLRRLAVPRDAAGALAALHLAFHPTQPWLLVAAADHTLRLYT